MERLPKPPTKLRRPPNMAVKQRHPKGRRIIVASVILVTLLLVTTEVTAGAFKEVIANWLAQQISNFKLWGVSIFKKENRNMFFFIVPVITSETITRIRVDVGDMLALTVIVMRLIIPVLEAMIIYSAIKLIIASVSPGERWKAKQQLQKMLTALILISVSPALMQMMIDLNYNLTRAIMVGPDSAFHEIVCRSGTCVKYGSLMAKTMAGFGGTGSVYILFCAGIITILAFATIFLRYIIVGLLAIIFPVTITLYMFDFTKSIGRQFLKHTLGWIYTPLIMAAWICVSAAIMMSPLGGADPDTALWLYTATSIMIIASPLMVTGILGALGNIVTSVGQILPSLAGVGFVLVGEAMQGQPAEAIVAAGVKQAANLSGGGDLRQMAGRVGMPTGEGEQLGAVKGVGKTGGSAAKALGDAAEGTVNTASAAVDAATQTTSAVTTALGTSASVAVGGSTAAAYGVGVVAGTAMEAGTIGAAAGIEGAGIATSASIEAGGKVATQGIGMTLKTVMKSVGQAIKTGVRTAVKEGLREGVRTGFNVAKQGVGSSLKAMPQALRSSVAKLPEHAMKRVKKIPEKTVNRAKRIPDHVGRGLKNTPLVKGFKTGEMIAQRSLNAFREAGGGLKGVKAAAKEGYQVGRELKLGKKAMGKLRKEGMRLGGTVLGTAQQAMTDSYGADFKSGDEAATTGERGKGTGTGRIAQDVKGRIIGGLATGMRERRAMKAPEGGAARTGAAAGTAKAAKKPASVMKAFSKGVKEAGGRSLKGTLATLGAGAAVGAGIYALGGSAMGGVLGAVVAAKVLGDRGIRANIGHSLGRHGLLKTGIALGVGTLLGGPMLGAALAAGYLMHKATGGSLGKNLLKTGLAVGVGAAVGGPVGALVAGAWAYKKFSKGVKNPGQSLGGLAKAGKGIMGAGFGDFMKAGIVLGLTSSFGAIAGSSVLLPGIGVAYAGSKILKHTGIGRGIKKVAQETRGGRAFMGGIQREGMIGTAAKAGKLVRGVALGEKGAKGQLALYAAGKTVGLGLSVAGFGIRTAMRHVPAFVGETAFTGGLNIPFRIGRGAFRGARNIGRAAVHKTSLGKREVGKMPGLRHLPWGKDLKLRDIAKQPGGLIGGVGRMREAYRTYKDKRAGLSDLNRVHGLTGNENAQKALNKSGIENAAQLRDVMVNGTQEQKDNVNTILGGEGITDIDGVRDSVAEVAAASKPSAFPEGAGKAGEGGAGAGQEPGAEKAAESSAAAKEDHYKRVKSEMLYYGKRRRREKGVGRNLEEMLGLEEEQGGG